MKYTERLLKRNISFFIFFNGDQMFPIIDIEKSDPLACIPCQNQNVWSGACRDVE